MKNRTGRMVRIILTLMLTAAMLFAAMVPALAAASEEPDLSKKGSITVTIRDTKTGKPVTAGVLTSFKVADLIKDESGSYTLKMTKEFEKSGLSLEELDTANLAAKLAAYATAMKLKGTEKKVSDKGTVEYPALTLGLYLLMQTGGSEELKINSFLVTVPRTQDSKLVYDVDATPKVKAETPTVTPSVTPSTTPSVTPSKTPTTTVPPNIPQTGQLWWPVPVLAIFGLIFIIFGWKRNEEQR